MKFLKALVTALALFYASALLSSDFQSGQQVGRNVLDRMNLSTLGSEQAVIDAQANAATGAELEALTGLRGEGTNIENVARERLGESEAGILVEGAATSRPHFEFDRENDPIFRRADAITADAESIAGLVSNEFEDCRLETSVISPGTFSQQSCTHWPVPEDRSCERTYQAQCTATIRDADFTVINQSGDSYLRRWSMSSLGRLRVGTVRSGGQYWQSRYNTLHRAVIEFNARNIQDITEFRLLLADFDDWIRVSLNGTYLYNFWGSGEGNRQPRYPNADALPYLVEGKNTLIVEVRVTDGGHGWIEFNARQNRIDCTGEWVSSGICDDLAQKNGTGQCQLTAGEYCAEGPETRMISGYPHYQACWKYRTDYSCHLGRTEAGSECIQLQQSGCTPVSTSCIDWLPDGGTCAAHEQIYSCPNGDAVTEEVMVCDGTAFCLDGNCADTSYEPNSDFALAASYLAMMEDLGDDFDQDNLTVFGGQALRCDDKRLFNCCRSASILGAIDMERFCGESDLLLAERRGAGQCHYVGRRCGDKVLGVCTRYVESWCCFNGKLGRILQEQGRAQLGIGWGSAQQPNCRGLTPDELQLIDWSQLDLSEFFADALERANPPDGQSLSDELKNRVQGLLP